jgi:hypothetical protein
VAARSKSGGRCANRGETLLEKTQRSWVRDREFDNGIVSGASQRLQTVFGFPSLASRNFRRTRGLWRLR